MKRMILVSHGTFAAGLKNAVEVVMGQQEELYAVGLALDMNIEEFKAEFRKMIDTFDKDDEILLFCDILGGSPFTNALDLVRTCGFLERSVIVTGMCMPVLVQVLLDRDTSTLEELRASIQEMSPDLTKIFELEGEESEEEEL